MIPEEKFKEDTDKFIVALRGLKETLNQYVKKSEVKVAIVEYYTDGGVNLPNDVYISYRLNKLKKELGL